MCTGLFSRNQLQDKQSINTEFMGPNYSNYNRLQGPLKWHWFPLMDIYHIGGLTKHGHQYQMALANDFFYWKCIKLNFIACLFIGIPITSCAPALITTHLIQKYSTRWSKYACACLYIDGLAQERCNSIANALELCFFFALTNEYINVLLESSISDSKILFWFLRISFWTFNSFTIFSRFVCLVRIDLFSFEMSLTASKTESIFVSIILTFCAMSRQVQA